MLVPHAYCSSSRQEQAPHHWVPADGPQFIGSWPMVCTSLALSRWSPLHWLSADSPHFIGSRPMICSLTCHGKWSLRYCVLALLITALIVPAVAAKARQGPARPGRARRCQGIGLVFRWPVFQYITSLPLSCCARSGQVMAAPVLLPPSGGAGR